MKLGLIGFGFMGGVHLAALERVEHASVIAVASRTRPVPGGPTRGNLQDVKAVGLPDHVAWVSDWRKILADPEIDAVDVCLPTNLHKEVVLRAFEAGKHVLCEKPMALTAEDCDVMLEAAARSGRTFMVGQVLRFMIPYRYAATFIAETCRGNVKTCTFSRKTGYPRWSEWLSREEQSGGAILDLLSHDIDQALKLFGQPESVSAVSQGEIDTMVGTLHYASGLRVKIEGGWLAPEAQFSAGCQIEGDEATLSFNNGKLTERFAGQNRMIALPEQDDYYEQIAYFVECCRKNVAPTECPPQESAQAVRIANLLRTSRENQGKEVSCET